jgi:hypothetical protein
MAELECCGVECRTTYCPHCGSQVNSHNARTLLRHIWKTIESKKKKLEQTIEESPDGNHSRATESIDMWEAWSRDLMRLMETVEVTA